MDHRSDGPIDPSNPKPRTQRRKHAAEKGADAGDVGSVSMLCLRQGAAAHRLPPTTPVLLIFWYRGLHLAPSSFPRILSPGRIDVSFQQPVEPLQDDQWKLRLVELFFVPRRKDGYGWHGWHGFGSAYASWHLEFEAENGMGLMDLLPVPQLSPSKGMPLWGSRCNYGAM